MADDTGPTVPDSTREQRGRYPAHATWEKVVSFPGTVASLPFVLVFKTAEGVAGLIHSQQLIPRTINLLMSDDGRTAIYPTFSNRSGAGLKFFHKDFLNPEAKLTLTATGAPSGRQRYRVELKRIDLGTPVVRANLTGRYWNYPGEAFFGIGPETREGDRVGYDHERMDGEAWLDFRPHPNLTLHLLGGVERSNIFAGTDERTSITEVYSRETLPGLQAGVELGRVEAGLEFRSIDSEGQPTRGQELFLNGARYRDLRGDRYDFTRWSGEVRQYVELFARRVVMLRVHAAFTDPVDDGDAVPFFLLHSIGRRETIRGFDRGRFHDLDKIEATIEYRIPLWRKLDFTLFAEAGQVAGDLFEELERERVVVSGGFGLRLFTVEEVVAQLQLAVSRERVRVYFNLF